MEYNTTRNLLTMREYGRHVQKMVEHIMTIEDPERRQRNAQAAIELMGSAYAFVYPSLFEGFGLPVIEAMASGIPVLCSGRSAMEEIADGAAYYFDPEDPSSIAEKMMLIYKDEKGRNELVEKGLERSRSFTWQKTAEGLWNSIIFAAQNGSYE